MAMDEVTGRLEAALDAMSEVGPSVIAGEPWPPAKEVGPGPESSWGPKEVLAHVAEMLPFWMGEIELIVDASAVTAEGNVEPPAFGRLEADELRVAVIDRDRVFPSRELLARIEVEGRRVLRRLRELDAREAETLGRHPTRGDMTVTEIAERLITGHLEGHVTQLRETLAAR
jgi:hypothetical protein